SCHELWRRQRRGARNGRLRLRDGVRQRLAHRLSADRRRGRGARIVTVSIELCLELHYEFSSGKCVGKATLTIEVDICMFSVSVEITCERKFAGSSGDPTFAEIMAPQPTGESPWNTYCEAFAA